MELQYNLMNHVSSPSPYAISNNCSAFNSTTSDFTETNNTARRTSIDVTFMFNLLVRSVG